MLKFLTTAIIVSLMIGDVNAQQQTSATSNPFRNLQFFKSATDTISFVVNYDNNFGNISESNANTIAVITKNSGATDLKNLTYAIGFSIPGYPQKFYAPCGDINLYKLLSAKQTGINKLRISCVAYRFYYSNITYNFFYIDKAVVLN